MPPAGDASPSPTAFVRTPPPPFVASETIAALTDRVAAAVRVEREKEVAAQAAQREVADAREARRRAELTLAYYQEDGQAAAREPGQDGPPDTATAVAGDVTRAGAAHATSHATHDAEIAPTETSRAASGATLVVDATSTDEQATGENGALVGPGDVETDPHPASAPAPWEEAPADAAPDGGAPDSRRTFQAWERLAEVLIDADSETLGREELHEAMKQRGYQHPEGDAKGRAAVRRTLNKDKELKAPRFVRAPDGRIRLTAAARAEFLAAAAGRLPSHVLGTEA